MSSLSLIIYKNINDKIEFYYYNGYNNDKNNRKRMKDE